MTRRLPAPRSTPAKAGADPFRTRFIPGQRLAGNIDGDGHRRYTVVRVGRTYITLIDVSTVTALKIPRDALETSRAVRIADDSSPATVLALLAANLTERLALGLRVSGEIAAEALDLLEGLT